MHVCICANYLHQVMNYLLHTRRMLSTFLLINNPVGHHYYDLVLVDFCSLFLKRPALNHAEPLFFFSIYSH